MSIRLKIIDHDDQHLLITTTEPARFEMSVIDGSLILHGYRGADIDEWQDPDITFDGIEDADSGSMVDMDV